MLILTTENTEIYTEFTEIQLFYVICTALCTLCFFIFVASVVKWTSLLSIKQFSLYIL
jgi:hypothetical protein